jgi:hypothetical protein
MATIKKGVVKVGDTDYRWSILRQPAWTRDENQLHKLLGVGILVESLEPSRRELVLEFDIDRTRHEDMPHHQRFHIHDGRLVEAIESAMRQLDLSCSRHVSTFSVRCSRRSFRIHRISS